MLEELLVEDKFTPNLFPRFLVTKQAKAFCNMTNKLTNKTNMRCWHQNSDL